jgi:hypothetical protein
LRVVLARLRQVRAYAAASGDAPDARSSTRRSRRRWRNRARRRPAIFPRRRWSASPAAATWPSNCCRWRQTPPPRCSTIWRPFRVRGWRKGWSSATPAPKWKPTPPRCARAGSPFGNQVFVHYSNLERQRRQEIEEQFAQADAALCFASSTLELGIDIGSIDVAILIGAPGSAAAFAQRIGRAGRRQRRSRRPASIARRWRRRCCAR